MKRVMNKGRHRRERNGRVGSYLDVVIRESQSKRRYFG